MNDLISRQEAIDAVADLYWMDERLLNFKKEIDATFDKIKALPPAQPERKTGRLKYESAYNWFRCNVCRKIYPSEFLQYFDSCQYQPRLNFCPNCGCDMRGEEDG